MTGRWCCPGVLSRNQRAYSRVRRYRPREPRLRVRAARLLRQRPVPVQEFEAAVATGELAIVATGHGDAAALVRRERGYDVVVLEHAAGASPFSRPAPAPPGLPGRAAPASARRLASARRSRSQHRDRQVGEDAGRVTARLSTAIPICRQPASGCCRRCSGLCIHARDDLAGVDVAGGPEQVLARPTSVSPGISG